MAFSEMQWEKKSISLNNIILDSDNPRLGRHNQSSDVAALSYLVEHENVLGLARNIAEYKNLYPHESIICIPIEDDNYIVVEGNRRVAACKLLTKPYLISGSGDESEIPKIDDQTRSSISNLDACVADSRVTADEIIAKLHIDEFGKLSWNTRKKIRYVESRLRFGNDVEALASNLGISTKNLYKLKAYGRVFKYVYSMLKWSQKEQDVLWDDAVDLDIMFSVLTNNVIPSHFGHVLFSDAGEMNHDFPDKDEICKRIVQHTLISQRLHVDYKYTRNTAVRDYLNERFPRRAPTINSNLSLDLHLPIGTENTITTGGAHLPPAAISSNTGTPINENDPAPESDDQSSNSRYNRPKLLNSLNYSKTVDHRIKQLASEAKQISQIKTPQVISLSFLIRAILERGLILEIKKSNLSDELRKKHSDKAALDDLIKFCVQNKSLLSTPPQLIRAIQKTKQDDVIFEIHQNIHGGFGNLNAHRLEQICGFFVPVFDYFLENN